MDNNINRNLWIDYLRSFLTVLVVAHHSSLAYTTFAYFDTTTYINSTHPVVDASRWIGMDIFENFNDIFFMSLMFLISGLFVFKSLSKKGAKIFLYDRFKRLGIPFIVAVTLIIPIAYLPSFYLINQHFNIPLFIQDYIAHQQWPVGPPWFIWELLVFNVVSVIIPAGFYTRISTATAQLAKRPFLFWLACFTVVSIALIPLSLWVGQYKWTGWYPFDFQVNRVLLYFTFFLFGVCIGSGNWNSYLFVHDNLLNKPWSFWAIICLFCYTAITLLSIFGADIVKFAKLSGTAGWLIYDLFFVASCLASSFAFLAFFKQKVNTYSSIFTNLSANAFGIYLIHYVFVTWLQFSLLNVSLPVIFKFLIVFLGSLLLSWLIVIFARRFKGVNQII